MNSQELKDRTELANREFLRDILQIPFSGYRGIDLVDNRVGIEMKSRWQKYSGTFTIHTYQIEGFRKANPNQELFWAFLEYQLINRASLKTGQKVGQSITSRETWFIPWDWADENTCDFSDTKTGEVGDEYCYARKDNFPNQNQFLTIALLPNIFHFPKESILEERYKDLPQVHL